MCVCGGQRVCGKVSRGDMLQWLEAPVGLPQEGGKSAGMGLQVRVAPRRLPSQTGVGASRFL